MALILWILIRLITERMSSKKDEFCFCEKNLPGLEIANIGKEAKDK
jgi:hypothetical protein